MCSYETGENLRRVRVACADVAMVAILAALLLSAYIPKNKLE